MFERARILCFDLDNTLWDVWPVIARAEQTVHDWLAKHHPVIAARWTIAQMRELRMALARAEPALAHNVTALRIASLVQLARETGEPESVGERAFEVFRTARNEVTLYDDVRPALVALGRRHRLASFSNGNADLQRIGLAHHFEVSLAAADTGAAKPDPRAFNAVLRSLGASADDVVYIGDDPEADVAGARAAGMRTVWVNRGVMPWPEELAAADLEVSSLTELVTLSNRGAC